MLAKTLTHAQEVIFRCMQGKMSPYPNTYWDELYNESTRWNSK